MPKQKITLEEEKGNIGAAKKQNDVNKKKWMKRI